MPPARAPAPDRGDRAGPAVPANGRHRASGPSRRHGAARAGPRRLPVRAGRAGSADRAVRCRDRFRSPAAPSRGPRGSVRDRAPAGCRAAHRACVAAPRRHRPPRSGCHRPIAYRAGERCSPMRHRSRSSARPGPGSAARRCRSPQVRRGWRPGPARARDRWWRQVSSRAADRRQDADRARSSRYRSCPSSTGRNRPDRQASAQANRTKRRAAGSCGGDSTVLGENGCQSLRKLRGSGGTATGFR